MSELHLSHNRIGALEARNLIRASCRRLPSESLSQERRPLWLRLERQQVEWTHFELSEELQMEQVLSILASLEDELGQNADGPLLCLVKRTGRCNTGYCAHQHRDGPLVHLPYLWQQGSRYISGPDAHTRPEDVVPATPVPEVTLPPQSRWGLRKREPAVVFESDDMQVIDKPPYWNCRWNSTMGGVVSERRQLSHDRRSWQEMVNSGRPEYLDLFVYKRCNDEMSLAWPHDPERGAGFLHRLDCQTSGLIVRGKNEQSFQALKRQVHRRQVKKGYMCLAHGALESDGPMRVAARLSYSKEDQESRVDRLQGDEAETFVLPLAHAEWGFHRYTLCAIRITTGRTHQIRKHMEHLGHPLVADRTYNWRHFMSDKKWCPRLFLHAYEVWIDDGGTQHRFVLPLEEDLREAFFRLKLVTDFCEPGRLRWLQQTGRIEQPIMDELMHLTSETQTADTC